MRIINGLNYPYKIKKMIEECYYKATQHPYETFLFVAEDPYIVEQLFFKHTHYLVNIEIVSWSKFIQQLIIENHLTNQHVLTHVEWVYYLRDILNNEDFHCFFNDQPYPLIEKFIPLLKSYDLNQTHYSQDTFKNLKLRDFIHLYESLKKRCGEFTHITPESLCNHQNLYSPYHHIYIEADHHIETGKQCLINSLAIQCDVTLLYTHSNDSRLLNLPFCSLCKNAFTVDQPTHITKQLFNQKKVSSLTTENYFTFVAPTLHQEVKRVVYTIQQKIIDEGLKYQDFMIVYPHSSYIPLLIDILTSLHIPHQLPITSSCLYDKSYQKIISVLDTMQDSSIREIAMQLYQEELEPEYYEYLENLFQYHDLITAKEFKEFFVATYINHHQERSNTLDQISICTIDKVKTAYPKHVFFLGLNETILPFLIKDTGLLLDEDIQLLRSKGITTPLTTLEQLGTHHNDILKALLQPALSTTFSYCKQTLSGETLLESSLYKQLASMFTLQQLPDLQYLPLDDYYQFGGLISGKEKLNKNIQEYLQTHNQPLQLSKAVVEKLYSPSLSVSQIETYNKCPFQYFLQYGLGIHPIQDEQLMPNELGSLIHYVLSICIDQQQDIDSIVDNYIKQDKNLNTKISSSPINQYFIEQLKKDLEITLTVLKRQLYISEFNVQDKEKKIQQDISHMHFKGFVDRIDQYQNYVSIIDYKSSAKDIDINLALQGFNIQMLLYLRMVTELYQKDPGAVLYFNTKKRILSLNQNMNDPVNENDFYKQYRFGGYVVDDESHSVIKAMDPTFDKKSDIINVTYVKSRNEYKGQILTPKQLEHLLEGIEKHIYELYNKMREGWIMITPKGSDQSATHTMVNPCRYCPYHSICSFDIFYNDYDMVKFLDVNAILGGDDDAI